MIITAPTGYIQKRCLDVISAPISRYGRMNLGTCLVTDYGNLGCHSNVTGVFDQWCSGRPSCNREVKDLVDFKSQISQGCPPDLRGFVQAKYQCVPGERKRK